MAGTDRVDLFDHWAQYYDKSVAGDVGYPFAGYEQVLQGIVRLAAARPGLAILDLGIGTGNLAARFAAQGCRVWGLDFSSEMLARARQKVPEAVLVQADLLGAWPADFDRPFDRVVSAYLFHEFDLQAKVELLHRLAREHLAEQGRIVVGDIAFPSIEARLQAQARWAEVWDDEEYYWAADETAGACTGAGLATTYEQVSICGGIFTFGPE